MSAPRYPRPVNWSALVEMLLTAALLMAAPFIIRILMGV